MRRRRRMERGAVKDAKQLLERATKYISKGLEMGAYAAMAGGNLYAERLLKKIRSYLAVSRQRPAHERSLLDRSAKYIVKGLEMGAYTATVGGDLFAEHLLNQIRNCAAEEPKVPTRLNAEGRRREPQ